MLHLGDVEVMHLKGLGDVLTARQKEPVRATWVMLHELAKVVPLPVD